MKEVGFVQVPGYAQAVRLSTAYSDEANKGIYIPPITAPGGIM